MNAFYISGALILLRSIYRAVGEYIVNLIVSGADDLSEFISLDLNKRPPGGYLYVTEWPYFVLDGLPMAVSVFLTLSSVRAHKPVQFATFVYNILFPAKYLPRTKDEKLQKEDETPMAARTTYTHV